MNFKRGKLIRGVDRCFLCRKRRGEIRIGAYLYCTRCVSNIMKHKKLDTF
jgi:hypothetical protein